MPKLTIFLALVILVAATGCGTLTGVVGGPLMGGTSLTAKVYESDVSEGTMLLATPFTFLAGTAVGIFPATVTGVSKDLGADWKNVDFVEILDPFNAGLFQTEKPSRLCKKSSKKACGGNCKRQAQ